ncbi:MAG: TolC family protein [Planctomycetes bacterium]|nr:TolC family protein [Planctomycetota bacterium]
MNRIGRVEPVDGAEHRIAAGWAPPSLIVIVLLGAMVGCHDGRTFCTDWYLNRVSRPFDTTEPRVDAMAPRSSGGAAIPGASERSGTQSPDGPSSGLARLPDGFPGAAAPPLALPPREGNTPSEAWLSAFDGLYPALPTPPETGQPETGQPEGERLSLATLQAMAMEHSPRILQVAGEVESARGSMIQAGLYPNPWIGYQSDTVNTANTRGYHGIGISQDIVTMGKVALSRQAAGFDLQVAELALERTRFEVASDLRARYFELVVLAERRKLAHAMTGLCDRIYQAQVDLARGGETAPYEPMQLRVLSLQSRGELERIDQSSLGAWRRLAATIGVPELPMSDLSGRADDAIPLVDFDRLAARMLANHTDLRTAWNQVAKAEVLLRLAEVTPFPNLTVTTAIQRDYTFVPGTTSYNLQVGGDVPVFDRNQGNIVTARGNLYQAEQSVDRARNALLGDLAEAFSRYEANRRIARTYRNGALPDQVRVFRAIYDRYRTDPLELRFNDVVVAQQTLGSLLNQYLDLLGGQWNALVDLGRVAQADDLFSLGAVEEVEPIPEIEMPESDR